MLSYTHLSLLEKQLFENMNDLHAVFNAARNDLNQQRINTLADKYDVRKRLYTYLANGFSYTHAVENLSLDFKLPENIIKELTLSIYQQYNSTLLPYKIYAAHKLKIAGITNKKIAEILSVTPQTISKYLTIDIDFK